MNMTIEKLAEIVNQQWSFDTPFRRTAKEWQAFCESAARSVATAVLAEVTENENRCLSVAERIGANRVMNSRLVELMQVKQPSPADASKSDVSDDEVEMVAKAIYNEAAVNPVSVEGPYSKDPRHGASRSARWAARAALSAMNRGERWGVWERNEGAWVSQEVCGKNYDFVSSNQMNASHLCRVLTKLYGLHYEVLPYPSTPQVQVQEGGRA